MENSPQNIRGYTDIFTVYRQSYSSCCTEVTADGFSKAENQRWLNVTLLDRLRVETFLSFDSIDAFHEVVAELVYAVTIAIRRSFDQLRKRLKIYIFIFIYNFISPFLVEERKKTNNHTINNKLEMRGKA